MAAITICSDFGAQENVKSVTAFIVSLSICHEVLGPDAMILVFWMLSFKLAFSLSYVGITRIPVLEIEALRQMKFDKDTK